MEEAMREAIALPLALGIALAVPVSAYAAPNAYRPVHHSRTIRRRGLALRAQAPAPRTIPALARSSAFGDTEADGLSRSPADCVKYGCIDNGGD